MGALVQVYEDVPGDHTARTRIVVNDESGNDQKGLIFGMRSRHYSAEPTAGLLYDAEDLTPRNTAAAATVEGAAAISISGITSTWTSLLSTLIVGGVGHMTHTGTYRVWARLYVPGGGSPLVPGLFQFRLVWDVGDLVLAEENAAKSIPSMGDWYWLDLGEIRIDPAPAGTHYWQGLIQAQSATIQLDEASIDKLAFVPVDDGYGVLSSAGVATDGVTDEEARDDFSQSAGALTGKTAPLGGVWVGDGDASDFAVHADDYLERTAVSDAAGTGRFAVLPVDLDTVDIDLNVDQDALISAGPKQGCLARYVDDDNHLRVVTYINETGTFVGTVYAEVIKRVASVDTTIGSAVVREAAAWSLARTIHFEIDNTGAWRLYVDDKTTLLVAGVDSDLDTGGALESGGVGVYDEHASATASTRTYDDFVARVGIRDGVILASGTIELRHDGFFRRDSSGTAYSPLAPVAGNFPRLPPGGMEAQPVELIVLTSRGDFDQLPDAGGDDEISVEMFVRPTWMLPTL